MSDPNSDKNEERPTIEGTDPDMNVGDGQKFDAADGKSERLDDSIVQLNGIRAEQAGPIIRSHTHTTRRSASVGSSMHAVIS